jgi:hypothetical protein
LRGILYRKKTELSNSIEKGGALRYNTWVES